MEDPRPVSADLSHYLGVFRRHWWIVLAAGGLGLALGAAYTQTVPKVYESSTSVLVQAVSGDTDASGGRTKGTINLDTEAQLVVSGAVAVKAATLLRSPVSPLVLAHDVAVEVPANTTVLVIRFQSNDPQAAQAGSHAFAEAYLRNRDETARAITDQRIKALNLKVKQLSTDLTGINTRMARAREGSFERSNLESLRNNQQNQLNSITGRLNDLTTATVSAGSIISDARVPDAPVSPNALLNIAAGGMIGLLGGFLLAFARERFDRRVRSAADVRDRGRITVLAALDERTTPGFDDVLQPYGPGGRIFNRLRNEILASLRSGDQIIVVTGASRGSATTLVAANLAAALARTGSDVVLIGAHLPDSVIDATPLARMLGVAPMPGLSDLLAGRIGLAKAMQRSPRIPTLRIITTGGTATAAGLMQSQRLRDTLEALRRQTGYVVIEAPSTSSSADAQGLASLADAAILAVELRRAKRPALLDAAEQLSRVGTPLLGAVVLPRLAPIRTDDEELPVVTLPAERREPRMEQRREVQPAVRAEQRPEDRGPRSEDRGPRPEEPKPRPADRGPRPAETPGPDQERTQQLRIPTGLVMGGSGPKPGKQARPRPTGPDDVTAVINLGQAGLRTRTTGEPETGEQPGRK